MAELKKKYDGSYNLSLKRVYAPYELHQKCTRCGNELIDDFFDQPIMTESDFGRVFKYSCYCEECEDETEETVKLRVDVVVSMVDDDENE